jgi:hypothetical protein
LVEKIMLELRQTTLHYAGEGIAKVRCARCRAPLGGIRVYSSGEDKDRFEWMKAQEELDALGHDHESNCPDVPVIATVTAAMMTS